MSVMRTVEIPEMAKYLSFLLLFTCASIGGSNPRSCQGRCGQGYYKGSLCQCDYECLGLNECCPDFEDLCTTRNSCKGRCGEPFNRGNPCHCDIECTSFNQCCFDYESQCLVEESSNEDMSDDEEQIAPVETSPCEVENKTRTVSSQGPTNTISSEGPTNTISSEGPTTTISTEGPTTTISTECSTGTMTTDGSSSTITEGSTVMMTTADSTSTTTTEESTSTISSERPTTIFSSQGTTTVPTEEPTTTVTDSPTSTVSTEMPTSVVSTEDPTSTVTTESPISTVPAEEPTSTVTTESPISTVPAEEPTSTVTTESSISTVPTKKPTTTIIDSPTSTATTEIPASIVSTEDPTTTVTTESPLSTVPTKEPTSIVTTESPLSTVPTQEPTSTVTTESPLSIVPTQEPTSTVTTENPISTAPTEKLTTIITDSPTSTVPTEMPKSIISKEDPTSTVTLGSPTSNVTPRVGPASTILTPGTALQINPTKDSLYPQDLSFTVSIKPTQKPTKPSSVNDKIDFQSDDYDTDLCSGRPISGLTTLKNGTMVAFRGHYFWTLDKERNPDPPRLIRSVWGIPSPIDTVFTRCNCQGNTYFFKGSKYWRFEDGTMDHGYPKPINQGFGQINHITAALSIPQYRSRREAVIFFKRGGQAQKYTYQVTPSCRSKPTVTMFTVRNRFRRAIDSLGSVITISKTWRGFPSAVTSAISVPSRVREGYKYYVFSQEKHYSMKMEREKPVILKSANGQREKTANSFFKCPQSNKV